MSSSLSECRATGQHSVEGLTSRCKNRAVAKQCCVLTQVHISVLITSASQQSQQKRYWRSLVLWTSSPTVTSALDICMNQEQVSLGSKVCRFRPSSTRIQGTGLSLILTNPFHWILQHVWISGQWNLKNKNIISFKLSVKQQVLYYLYDKHDGL